MAEKPSLAPATVGFAPDDAAQDRVIVAKSRGSGLELHFT
jgi:hypothetical protein